MAAGAKSTILFVGIGLALLSLCYSLPNVGERKPSQHVKRQLPDNDTCIRNAVANGEISSACVQAISNGTSALAAAFCSSLCNSLYAANVKCYGTTFTQNDYKAGCKNGYQGAAGQVTFNFGIVLVSALIASLLKVVG